MKLQIIIQHIFEKRFIKFLVSFRRNKKKNINRLLKISITRFFNNRLGLNYLRDILNYRGDNLNYLRDNFKYLGDNMWRF